MQKKYLLLIVLPLLISCTARVKTDMSSEPTQSDGLGVFIEEFDSNDLRWICYDFAGQVQRPILFDGVLYSFSPWWIDYNHAPPGAGYLHILAGLHTHKTSLWKTQLKLPNDFTEARLTLRFRGELDAKGAEMLLLLQAHNGQTTGNFVLTGQPFKITPEWSEQTISLTPDPAQWVCLGSRADRTETYGCFDIADALTNMNVDFIFVLFPLTIESVELVSDKHLKRAGYNYHAKQELLPYGMVMIDWVKIEFD